MSDPSKPEDKDAETIREAVKRMSKAAKPAAKAPEPKPAEAVEKAVAAEPEKPSVDQEKLADAVRRAEAVLFASADPISAPELAAALPPGVEPGDVLVKLKAEYKNRGVNLVEVAGKWRFQTAGDLAFLFEETREQPRQLSRAAMETLAIVAYCQPVTRAEIEDVRGVQVSKGTVDVLMEAGWVKPRGRRRTPGRPITYGTTEAFLLHFGLESLDGLPGRAELQGSGMLSAEIPRDFDFAGSPRDPETGELLGEDPLEETEFQQDFLEGAEER